ncbi:MAG: DNA repair protein RadC [Anaerolineae bacterium]|nr:DNA repair protein RadC [Anaerolineae bacterium]
MDDRANGRLSKADEGYRVRICDIPEGERPRERFQRVGPSGMSQRELLAIILRSGTAGLNVLDLADRLLRQFNGLHGLARASLDELKAVHGIGLVKAIEIQTALELGRRMMLAERDAQPVVRSPDDAAQLLMLRMGTLQHEEVHLLLLDTRNRVTDWRVMYRGTLNAANMRIAELFREAVRANSAAIIVAHNHPSGDPTPSAEDIAVTRSIAQAGKLLDVDVLDHIVIAHNRYVSLKERGLL